MAQPVLVAFLQGNTSELDRLMSAAAGKPGIEHRILSAAADTEAWYGRMAKARGLTRYRLSKIGIDDNEAE